MAEIQIQIKNLPEIKAAFRKAPAVMTRNLNKAIKQVVFFVRAQSQRNAPVQTGRLRASAYTTFAPLRGEVGFNANYAVPVHEGYGSFVIRPKNKKALFWQGASHPVKQVRHPGYRGNPFLRNAVEQNDAQIQRFMEQAVDDTLQVIAKEGR